LLKRKKADKNVREEKWREKITGKENRKKYREKENKK
jgi:hypothetical protein